MVDSVYPEQRFSTKRHDIEDMIAAENDPKQRAFLIILNSINASLEANTKTVQEVSRSLEEHLERYEARVKNEEELLNKGRGMWKVLAWVLTAVQAGTLAFALRIENRMAESSKAIEALAQVDAVVLSRVGRLESLTPAAPK